MTMHTSTNFNAKRFSNSRFSNYHGTMTNQSNDMLTLHSPRTVARNEWLDAKLSDRAERIPACCCPTKRVKMVATTENPITLGSNRSARGKHVSASNFHLPIQKVEACVVISDLGSGIRLVLGQFSNPCCSCSTQ